MDAVPDADGQLGLASTFNVSLGLLPLADIVLGNGVWKASEKWALTFGIGAVVDCKGHVSFLVVPCEFLAHWELVANLEEVGIVLLLSSFIEFIFDTNWQSIVVVHLEWLD